MFVLLCPLYYFICEQANTSVSEQLSEQRVPMHIEIQFQNQVAIVAICDKVFLSSNISGIESSITELLAKGWRNIALTYPPGSFFNSYSIAALVRSHETIIDFAGTFVIVNPTPEIINFLEMFNIDDTIQTCETIEKLAQMKLKKNMTSETPQ
jgi:hypothetical protein